MKTYILNFWIWWYLVRGRDFLEFLLGIWNFTLGYFNVLPMLKNMFVPLYQDYSNIGILISIPIRFIWVVTGTILQLIITIPLVLVYFVYMLLPLLPFWGFISFMFNLF